MSAGSNETAPFKVVYMKDKQTTLWTWKLVTRAGAKLAISPEPYAKRWVARRALMRVISVNPGDYTEVDEGDSSEYPFTINQTNNQTRQGSQT